MTNVITRQRCKWCEEDSQLIQYHDEEWGRQVTDNDALFEALTLEIFQAGLSWKTILHKRENFRAAFEGFKIDRVADFDSEKVEKLLQDKGIVRHRRKIESTIENAKIAQEIIKREGSLISFFTSLSDEKADKQKAIKTTFCHVGLTTAESFLQAAGFSEPDHAPTCFLFKKKEAAE
ncbi:DNA-3-methyladenine glycosylase I [Alkalihalobacillus sp. AL-G]|uniref:DNA-3-methyladenine glycosylase I n=1 Tax=Alkalihalobacillus sp. AL-G TaxID=2926399 RepID=UPI00272BE725|nr:DNA-3-methyladenine glycosylase I [Alkalihalobacillus sp. AL-G]WLD93649.1 DNA-3-methyladenine glycosylase I [Alkalihalobacillus sp. AL-G]